MPSEFDSSELDFSKYLINNSDESDDASVASADAPTESPSEEYRPRRAAAPMSSSDPEKPAKPRSIADAIQSSPSPVVRKFDGAKEVPRPKIVMEEPPQEVDPTTEEEEKARIAAELEKDSSAFVLDYTGRHTDLIRDKGIDPNGDAVVRNIIRKQRLSKSTSSLIIIGVFVLIAVAAFFGINTGAKNITPGATTKDPIGQYSVIYENKLQELLPGHISPGAKITTVKTTPSGFEASDGNAITFNTYATKPAAEECRLVNSSDFCQAGLLTVGEVDLDVFYTRDVINSANFAEMAEFIPAPSRTKDQLGVAVTVVEFVGSPTRFLLTVERDGAGWYVKIPNDMPKEAVFELAKAI